MKIGRVVATVTFGLLLSIHAAAAQPYSAALERLAGIMGSLQFLSELCDQDGVDWRVEMASLIDASEPNEEARLRIADRYNLGYSGFAMTYRRCTPAAVEAIDRYRRLGAALIAEIEDAFPAPDAPVADG